MIRRQTIKRLSLISVFLCCFCVTAIAPRLANGQSIPLPEGIMKDAFTINGLHVIGVESDSDQRLRWATWGIHSKGGMSIVLALLTKTSNGMSILWSMEKHDCYEPQLIRLTSWRYGQYPIVALSFQYGALSEQLELYGIDLKTQPKKLGEKIGEKIEWSISATGEGIMVVHSKSKNGIMQTCYRWNNKALSLEKARCN